MKKILELTGLPIIKLADNSKKPIEKNWQMIRRTVAENEEIMKEHKGNFGIGLVKDSGFLVIDVDIKKGKKGLESLKKIEKDTGVSFKNFTIIVRTASGGMHIYLKIPKDFIHSIHHKDYPDLEFFSSNRFMVAPNSVIDDCRYSYANINNVFKKDGIDEVIIGEAPAKLLEIIKEVERTVTTNIPPIISNDKLKEILDCIDLKAENEKSYDEFFHIACECFHATGGQGFEVYDQAMADQGFDLGKEYEERKKKWESIARTSQHVDEKRTVLSLLARCPSNNRPDIDLGDFKIEDPIEELDTETLLERIVQDRLKPTPCKRGQYKRFTPEKFNNGLKIKIKTKEEKTEKELTEEVIAEKEAITDARTAIATIHKDNPTGSQIEEAFNKIGAVQNSTDVDLLVAELKKSCSLSKSLIESRVKSMKEVLKEKAHHDFAREIAEDIINSKIENELVNSEGDTIIEEIHGYNSNILLCPVSNKLMYFNGRFYEPVLDSQIKARVLIFHDRKIKDLQSYSPEIAESIKKTKQAPLMSQVLDIIKNHPYVVDNNDNFNIRGKRKPIINTRNCEITLRFGKSINGQFIHKKRIKVTSHNPKSYLQNMININYNPTATCDQFIKILNDIFPEQTDEMINFTFELMAYLLSPNKDLDYYFIFYGKGGDGKSTLIRIIIALLGDAAFTGSLNDLEKDNHAMSDLENKLCFIDEDFKTNTVLPDDILKKISGSTKLRSNRKNEQAYNFTPSTTALVSTNTLPKNRDNTRGTKRRAKLIKFNAQFHNNPSKVIKGIDEHITNNPTEMSGILNKTLEAYEKLRVRGDFYFPEWITSHTRDWLGKANKELNFINTRLATEKGQHTSLVELYDAYKTYCKNEEGGRAAPLSKTAFKEALIDSGITIEQPRKTYTAMNIILLTH